MQRVTRRRWPGERRGAVLVLVGLSLVVLSLFFGLVLDMGLVHHERRLEQTAADAAAIAGASEIFRGATTDSVVARARATATTHNYTNGAASTTVTVSRPP